MTLHHRSKVSSVINYNDYFTVFGSLGCCCRYDELGFTVGQTTFAECNSNSGYYYFPPAGSTCSYSQCPFGGLTGCCCSCKYMTDEERALLDADIYNAPFGMVDGVGQCECEDIGGRWINGPCDRTDPRTHCRKPNGVDVRLPKACCGVTLELQTVGGVEGLFPSPFCKDVCNSRDCADITIGGYVSTFYDNGRRCFFGNNAGGPVANNECRVRQIGDTPSGNQTAPPISYGLPVCNNSNFICWGNNCQQYVNLINNGVYINPTVGDYLTITKSGAASRLTNFNDPTNQKQVVGNGLFAPISGNYLYMRSRYGRAAFITRDNKVLFTGPNVGNLLPNVPYAPQDYNVVPFFKYQKVELGKYFAILEKSSNIGTRADFIGSLLPSVTFDSQLLQLSGVESVHALEEAFCISRLNFATNNIEFLCAGYPFSKNTLVKVAGGYYPNPQNPESSFHETMVPESISCNGFHCTYKIQRLDNDRNLMYTRWETKGEYKRTKDQYGNVISIPEGRINTYISNEQVDFINGRVVAGHNFDCFLEGVTLNPATNEGTTRLSCYGQWDPSDTNKQIAEILDHDFGVLVEYPNEGSLYADCDYDKCVAVMPSINYCEDNTLGFCCLRDECRCDYQLTATTCAERGGQFYQGEDEFDCPDCIASCGFQCGTTLENSGNGIYLRYIDIDASGSPTKTDESFDDYIEVKLKYKTFAQEDRIIVIAKTTDDPAINAIINRPLSPVYGLNGGPASDNYLNYAPFNTPISVNTGPHPYFSDTTTNLTPCPADAVIFDSGCVGTGNQFLTETIRVYGNQVDLNPNSPNYKKLRLVVFGGCQLGSSGTVTAWDVALECPQ